ncbi:transposase [Cellulomonas bogoriensis 69B4 = DSM 16987]|uniref:Transposase n=1 Tax=Cellulomonas bogoriensis 69B4 = DSM 16987 TaxID=1386082 RepID=A0A0A0BNN2_9CELL|nr:transposase [Cellulomonas bogoriensis 69B4 = DSM 16987]
MPLANAPLTPAGRLHLAQRCQPRPIAHVAADAGISRRCLSKWKARYDELGEVGLLDRSSVPHASPMQMPADVVELIERLRRDHKWTVRRIHLELTRTGHRVSSATVSRWLTRRGINRRRDIDPDGSTNRSTGRITARYPGHIIHLDVKKVGRIPDGGGWRAHGINRLVRVVTDNGANYKATAFTRTVLAVASRHQRIRPHTPRHNGKVCEDRPGAAPARSDPGQGMTTVSCVRSVDRSPVRLRGAPARRI